MRLLPVLRGASQGQWDRLLRLRSTRLYSKGRILFHEGDRPMGMFFLCSGRVKIIRTDSQQHRHISRIVEAPDLLGDRAFIAGQPYQGTGEVMEKARACFLKAEHCAAVFFREPAVARELARRFARELAQAEEKTRDLALRSIRERLAKHLLQRLDAEGAALLSLTESRRELAELLGACPEAVSRALAEFRAKSLIAFHGRWVRVLDQKRLRQVAKPRPTPGTGVDKNQFGA